MCRYTAPRLKKRRSRWASNSRRELPRAGVVLLIGNLGRARRRWRKASCEGRGAASADEVSSPTFTLIHEYGAATCITSICTGWTRRGEVATLGLDELFERDALVLIEWGERFPELMPARADGDPFDAHGRRVTRDSK